MSENARAPGDPHVPGNTEATDDAQATDDTPVFGNRHRPWVPGIKVIGEGVRPRNARRELTVPDHETGSCTLDDPAIYYVYNVRRCPLLGNPALRAFLEQELRDVCRVTGMRCIVVRTRPHNLTAVRDPRTGQYLTQIGPSGQTEHVLTPDRFRITVFLGRAFSRCLLEGHIYTRKRWVGRGSNRAHAVVIDDVWENERWNPENLEPIELYLVSKAEYEQPPPTTTAPGAPTARQQPQPPANAPTGPRATRAQREPAPSSTTNADDNVHGRGFPTAPQNPPPGPVLDPAPETEPGEQPGQQHAFNPDAESFVPYQDEETHYTDNEANFIPGQAQQAPYLDPFRPPNFEYHGGQAIPTPFHLPPPPGFYDLPMPAVLQLPPGATLCDLQGHLDLIRQQLNDPAPVYVNARNDLEQAVMVIQQRIDAMLLHPQPYLPPPHQPPPPGF